MLDGLIYNSCRLVFDEDLPSCTFMVRTYDMDSFKRDYRNKLINLITDHMLCHHFHISHQALNNFLMVSFKLILQNQLRRMIRRPGLDDETGKSCLNQDSLERDLASAVTVQNRLNKEVTCSLKRSLPTLWSSTHAALWIEDNTIFSLSGHENILHQAREDIGKVMRKAVFKHHFESEIDFLTNHLLIRDLQSLLFDLTDKDKNVKRAAQTAQKVYAKLNGYIHRHIPPMEKLDDLETRFNLHVQKNVLPEIIENISGINKLCESFKGLFQNIEQIGSMSDIAAGAFNADGFELISNPDGSFYIGKHTGPYIVEHCGPLYFKFPDAFCAIYFMPQNVLSTVYQGVLPRVQVVNNYGPHMFIRDIGKPNQTICMGDTLQRIAADGRSLAEKVMLTLIYADKVLTQGHHSENGITPFHTFDKGIFKRCKITTEAMKAFKKEGGRVSSYNRRRGYEEKIPF